MKCLIYLFFAKNIWRIGKNHGIIYAELVHGSDHIASTLFKNSSVFSTSQENL